MNLNNAVRFSVNGKEYRTELFKGRESTKMLWRLSKAIGKPLAVMAKAGKAQDKMSAILESLPDIAELLFSLSPDEAVELLVDLLRKTCNDKDQILGDKYDDIFSGGNQLEVFLIAKEVITLNYKDFLSVVTFGAGDKGQ